MSSPPSKARVHFEKFLGVKAEKVEEEAPSIRNADPFIEREPTVGEFLEEFTPSGKDIAEYFYNLFPFLSWIGKYNLIWFIGDLVAGKLMQCKHTISV